MVMRCGNKIESIQRIARKLISQLKDKTYEERLQELGLPSLVYRAKERGHDFDVQDYERTHKDGHKHPIFTNKTRAYKQSHSKFTKIMP